MDLDRCFETFTWTSCTTAGGSNRPPCDKPLWCCALNVACGGASCSETEMAAQTLYFVGCACAPATTMPPASTHTQVEEERPQLQGVRPPSGQQPRRRRRTRVQMLADAGKRRWQTTPDFVAGL